MLYAVTIHNRTFLWPENELKINLKQLKSAHDLSCYWTRGRERVDSEETRNIIRQLKPQIEKAANKSLKILFRTSVESYLNRNASLAFRKWWSENEMSVQDMIYECLSFLPVLQRQKVKAVSRAYNAAVDQLNKKQSYLDLRTVKPMQVEAFEKFVRLYPNVTHVNLSYCTWITDDHLACFRDHNLDSLDLSFCKQITDRGIGSIRNQKLKKLSLEYCVQVTDEGVSHLPQMPLTHLSLWGVPHLTDEGFSRLSQMKFVVLKIAHANEFTGASFSLFDWSCLVELSLVECPVEDEAIMAFQGAQLSYCNIYGCTLLTDAALIAFQEMPLERLNVYRCEFSEEALEGLIDRGIEIERS